MREETNQNFRDHMLNYFIDLMDYVNDFSCSAAKASHAVPMNRGRSQVITRLIVLIAFEEQMHRNMRQRSSEFKCG